jgi:hypothetical protein
VTFAALVALGAGAAGAQSAQYTPPGSAAPEAGKTKEEIEQEMEDARWNLGPIRLAPWIGIRGLSYQQNVFAEAEGGTDDVTATAGAGLTAYLPTGPDVFWIAQVMPEYVYWADQTDRRQAAGRYGVGVYGDFNRLRLALQATRVEEQAEVTSEVPQLTVAEVDHLGASATLKLTPAIGIALSGSLADISFDEADTTDIRVPEFGLLARESRALRAGLRWEPRDVFALEAGAERTVTEFAAGARNLSSTGTSPYLNLLVTGNRIEVRGEVVQRSLEPEPGSRLVPVDATEGSLYVALRPGWRFGFGVYGHRSTVYSLAAAFSHFEEERYGVEVSAPFGRRIETRAFYEVGENDYVAIAAFRQRADDSSGYGVEATVELREWLSYTVGYRRLELDSNLPGLDRETSSLLSTISLTTGSWAWQ